MLEQMHASNLRNKPWYSGFVSTPEMLDDSAIFYARCANRGVRIIGSAGVLVAGRTNIKPAPAPCIRSIQLVPPPELIACRLFRFSERMGDLGLVALPRVGTQRTLSHYRSVSIPIHKEHTLNRNGLYLIVGALLVVVIGLGIYVYREETKPAGVELKIGKGGVSIKEN
jgi:hypothetical protein